MSISDRRSASAAEGRPVGEPAGPPLATLRLFARDLVPTSVTRIVAAPPEMAAPRGGGLARRGDGTRVTAREGTWFITTRNRGLGEHPEDHLRWVLRLLAAYGDELRQVVPDLRADLSLLVFDPGFEPGHLPAELLREAVAAGDLEIEVPQRGINLVLTARNLSEYLARGAA